MRSISAADSKSILRSQVRQQLSAIPEQKRLAEDEALFSAFMSLPQVTQANTLFLFYGVGTEPRTASLIDRLIALGKVVALPRMLPGHRMEALRYDPLRPLVQNRFGLWEPDEESPCLTAQQIDLTLVPALCYDRHNYRLGMGGGYYDRWLEHYHGITVGLCRRALLCDRLPTQPHDRPVDMVLTSK